MTSKQLGFLVGPGVAAGVGFATTVVLTNLVPPEVLGQYSLFATLCMLAATVFLLGTDVAYLRDAALPDQRGTLAQAGSLPLALSVVVGVLLTLFRNHVPRSLFPSDIGLIGVFGAFMIFGTVLHRFGTAFLRAREQGWNYSLWTVAPRLSYLAFLLGGVVIGGNWLQSASLSTQLLFVVGATVVPQVALGFAVFRRSVLDDTGATTTIGTVFSPLLLQWPRIAKLLRFGAPLVVANLMTLLLVTVDKVMLATTASVYDVGVYAAAARIAQLLMLAQTAFASVWWPVAFRWYESSVSHRRFQTTSVFVTVGFVALAILMTLVSRPVMALLGNDYRNSYLLVPLMMLHPLSYVVSEVSSVGIPFTRKTHFNLIVSGGALLVNATLNSVLIPKFGATGAAIASGLAWATFLIGRSILGAVAWHHTGSVEAYSAVAAFLGLAVAFSMGSEPVVIVMALIIGSILFFAAARLVRNRSDLAYLRLR